MTISQKDNPVRVNDVFVDELDLGKLGFEGMEPEVTGRPAYHPATMLKIYVYGYLNRIQSSRRPERETQRNVELIWLTGRSVCREFVVLCRNLQLSPRRSWPSTLASSEMSLHVLAYNFKRLIRILGTQRVIREMGT